jgi:hypothetical protein
MMGSSLNGDNFGSLKFEGEVVEFPVAKDILHSRIDGFPVIDGATPQIGLVDGFVVSFLLASANALEPRALEVGASGPIECRLPVHK